jgi:HD-GYP domain-containing protein (c-di-GMP phosphodiesterase class II)
MVIKANQPGECMKETDIENIKAIAAKKYIDKNGEEKPCLSDDEVRNLTIRKGSITDEEREIMQNHATVTKKMLDKIPFTKKLKNVPLYAAGHHECPNGKGYPLGLKGDELPIQARIMAIADFYEALTAPDRPYKKALPQDVALDIANKVAKENRLDKDLFDLFLSNKIYEKFNDLKDDITED